jgi:cytochrome c553
MQVNRFSGVLHLLILPPWLLAGSIAAAESMNASPPPGINIPVGIHDAAGQFAWDAVQKEVDAQSGDHEAKFFFNVTNISSSDAVIDHVTTSCHCTVAKLPSQPWVLKPHEDGRINGTVDIVGKSGTVFKTLTVFLADAKTKMVTGETKMLTVKVIIPNDPAMQRLRNQQMAMVDRERVLKDADCIHCHVDPTRGKTGKELFAAACGICHESEHRATMVPNLHALNHSTDRIYWKQWITTGKPGTLMPGFGAEVGGPLTPEQIDSLAEYLWETIPHDPQQRSASGDDVPAPQLNAGSAAVPVAR